MTIMNDLTPAIVDVIVPQGSYTGEFFQLYRNEEQTDPLDLSGVLVESMIRLNYDSPTPILTLSSTNGKIIVGASIINGTIVNDLPSRGGIAVIYDNETTSAIHFKGDVWEGVRDIEIEDANGIRKRIIQGNFTLTREVTR